MPKRKNRFHRWLAMALTVALLAGQSHVFVLAEEGSGDVPPTAEISEEGQAGAGDEGGTGNDEGGASDEGTEDGATGNDGVGDGGEDSGDTEDGEDGQDCCACETACTAENVNADCPVCAVNYDACVGNAEGGGRTSGGYNRGGDCFGE